jgi:hypothetical protein
MSAKVVALPVSAEAMSRLTTLAGSVTIDTLQRAELALEAALHPARASTLIAMYFAPGTTAAERERILQLLEARQ